MTMTTATTTVNRKAILRGDTFQVRSVLKDHKWLWDADDKVWTKVANWDDEADVIRNVRLYAGIRNRGAFTAELVDIA